MIQSFLDLDVRVQVARRAMEAGCALASSAAPRQALSNLTTRLDSR